MSDGQDVEFELPKNVEKYLAMLSKHYAQEGNRKLQEIIVNSQIRVEEHTYDNWNGGTYGYALHFVLPEALFSMSLPQKEEYERKIGKDINQLSAIPNEFVAKVSIELGIDDELDWRKKSGVLVTDKKSVGSEAEQRIWGDEDRFRLFLSHKAEAKKDTAALKEKLALFGVSSFVAHKDIRPTKEWQNEIENALASMDGFVALMTEGFHNSYWTDQEVGYGFARGVPLIAVQLGTVPYGFIGKFQALTANWEGCALEIVKLLINNERMLAAYLRALRSCPSFDSGNILAQVLPAIERLTPAQVDELIAAYNECGELQRSFGFNGKGSRGYGEGVLPHLKRLDKRTFKFGKSGEIEEVKAADVGPF